MNIIENEDQLRRTYEHLTRIYRQRDEAAAETVWPSRLRQMVVQSTEAMIRALETQVAEFLARRKEQAA